VIETGRHYAAGPFLLYAPPEPVLLPRFHCLNKASPSGSGPCIRSTGAAVPGVAMRGAFSQEVRMDAQAAIADHFREQVRWRSEKAAEYPDDYRNEQCADGLEELAAYVLSLPADDERIIELGTLGVRDGLFSPFSGDLAAYAISRFRFDDGRDECGGFLANLVKRLRDDAIRFAKQHA
jgi:hypothetical protein